MSYQLLPFAPIKCMASFHPPIFLSSVCVFFLCVFSKSLLDFYVFVFVACPQHCSHFYLYSDHLHLSSDTLFSLSPFSYNFFCPSTFWLLVIFFLLSPPLTSFFVALPWHEATLGNTKDDYLIPGAYISCTNKYLTKNENKKQSPAALPLN